MFPLEAFQLQLQLQLQLMKLFRYSFVTVNWFDLFPLMAISVTVTVNLNHIAQL